MINFVKFYNKFLKPLLTVDLPWSCSIKYCSSSGESILRLYKQCTTLSMLAGAGTGSSWLGLCRIHLELLYKHEINFFKKMIILGHLKTGTALSTEFSQTWRCDHSKATYLSFILDNPQQNLTTGSKDMINFVKFSNK